MFPHWMCNCMLHTSWSPVCSLIGCVTACSILAGVLCVPSLDAGLFNLASYDLNGLVLLSSYAECSAMVFASYGHVIIISSHFEYHQQL